jgi:hypothetical protein
MNYPKKRTSEALEILKREAAARRQCTPNKQLARRLGLSPGYVGKILWQLAHDPAHKFGSTLPDGPLEPGKIA